MDKEIERAKKLLESNGYEVSKRSTIDTNRVKNILSKHHNLMERLKK